MIIPAAGVQGKLTSWIGGLGSFPPRDGACDGFFSTTVFLSSVPAMVGMSRVDPMKARATRMLVLCTAFWAVSFPTVKSMNAVYEDHLPGRSSWFLTALGILARFLLSALCLLPVHLKGPGPTLPSRREWRQGLILGLFGGSGILLQMDGLAYTEASTSAFLTQFYCLLLPIWTAIQHRRRPDGVLIGCCLAVLCGSALLASPDWTHFHLGRGEVETLLGSVLFTGQILALEHPGFASNRTVPFSMVMFFTMALLAVPVACVTTDAAGDWLRAFSTWRVFLPMTILVGLCTLGSYMLMNHWQRHLPATHAGLLYCLEPVFTSGFALCLPGWFSRLLHVNYPNEQLTLKLIAGGGLITLANVVLQIRPPTKSLEPVAPARS